jgi:phenylacetate-CoA ligase
VIDHHGLTEVGPLSYECWEAPGFLHLNEAEFIVEILKPGTNQVVPDGQQGELIVTNLGRTASPVIRYRTGDIVVRTRGKCPCGRTTARLVGGVLARTDDMINVKGVNVFPTAIESVVRSFQEVVEFQTTVIAKNAMRSLSVTIEVDDSIEHPSTIENKVSRKLYEALGLSISVTSVEPGTLPRFDMKARRFIVE